MKYGIVIRNVTDLRAEPTFHSERKSQLIFNEAVRIGQRQNNYVEVRQSDGYSGWVDFRSLAVVPKEKWLDYGDNLKFQVIAPTVRVFDGEHSPFCPPFLFYGSRLKVVKKTGRGIFVELVDGSRIRLRSGLIRLVARGGENGVRGDDIVREARKFLGTPYLWGGMTPFGFDCSGLVKMVFRVCGIELPRDSKDQRLTGEWINIDEVKKGDLRFFRGHVAIALGRYRIIHSSLSGGGVLLNSLDPGDPDFREDLASIFLEDRRVLI